MGTQFTKGVACFEEDVPAHAHVEPEGKMNLDGWLNA
jgi:hypothetical protein